MPRHVLSLTLSDAEHDALAERAGDRPPATVARQILARALRVKSDARQGRPPRLVASDYTDALAHYAGDEQRAADALGCHVTTLRRACERHGIALPWTGEKPRAARTSQKST